MSTITTARVPTLGPARCALVGSPTASLLGRYTERDTGVKREIARGE